MYVTRYIAEYRKGPDQALLVNALTGAVDLVGAEALQLLNALRQGEPPNGDSDLLQRMLDRGYVLEHANQEQQILQRLSGLFEAFRSHALDIVICPTYGCNLRCIYCYEGELRSRREVMRREQIDAIFEAIPVIAEMRRASEFSIELFGGEPLLRSTYEGIANILQRASEFSPTISVTAISNGTNIPYYKKLFERYKRVLLPLQITIDGPKEIHDQRRVHTNKRGTFDCIVEGVDLLIELGIGVRVRVNVDSHNIDALPALADFVIERGWHKAPRFKAGIAPVTDHQKTGDVPNILPEDEVVDKLTDICQAHPQVEEIFELSMFRVLSHVMGILSPMRSHYDLPRMSFCEANSLRFFVFGPDNHIYACPEAIGEPVAAIGTYFPELALYEDRIAVWDNRSILTIPKCRECPIATFCGGGCAYAALKTNGDIRAPVCGRAPEVLRTYIEKSMGRRNWKVSRFPLFTAPTTGGEEQ